MNMREMNVRCWCGREHPSGEMRAQQPISPCVRCHGTGKVFAGELQADGSVPHRDLPCLHCRGTGEERRQPAEPPSLLEEIEARLDAPPNRPWWGVSEHWGQSCARDRRLLLAACRILADEGLRWTVGTRTVDGVVERALQEATEAGK